MHEWQWIVQSGPRASLSCALRAWTSAARLFTRRSCARIRDAGSNQSERFSSPFLTRERRFLPLTRELRRVCAHVRGRRAMSGHRDFLARLARTSGGSLASGEDSRSCRAWRRTSIPPHPGPLPEGECALWRARSECAHGRRIGLRADASFHLRMAWSTAQSPFDRNRATSIRSRNHGCDADARAI